MTTRLLVLALAGSVACGVQADGPPDVHVDRTACAHCGMLVSERIFAAAYRAPGAEAQAFDDIQCLLDAVRREAHPDALRIWVHDAAAGDWIDGRHAAFVGSPALRTPMGGGFIAYRDAAAARERAAKHQGSVVRTFDDLLRSSDPGGSRAREQAR